MKVKSTVFLAMAAVAGMDARGEVVDQHRVAEWRFAVTNGTEAVQTVEGVRVSCPCLRAEDIAGREIAPGGTAPNTQNEGNQHPDEGIFGVVRHLQ